MSDLMLAGGLRPRVAKKSDDYVQEILRRRGNNSSVMTTEAKTKKLALILIDQANGIRRLGVGMIGPIQLKLRYQGIVRNVLVEDPITPGTPVEYDVWDDLGQAYIMSGTDGEVRITAFEGKRVPVRFFRIASQPATASTPWTSAAARRPPTATRPRCPACATSSRRRGGTSWNTSATSAPASPAACA
jgi:hypothetical protein